MSLIHIDGFDHYGDDETKMTEGVYDQVDADFSLSSVNPRTGSYSLRRNNSASDSYVIKSLGDDYTCIGAGFCIYIDNLPSQDSAYPVIEFLYNDTQHVTLIIQNDGAIYIKYGGLNGSVIATSEPNSITSGEFSHIEMAACVDSFDGQISTDTTITKKETWKYLVENQFSTNDYSDPNFDDSSWDTSTAPFMHQTPHPYLPDLGWTNDGGTEIGAENLVWMRKTIVLTFSSTVTFNLAFDNVPTLYVDGVEIGIDIGEVIPGQPQAWIGTAMVDLSSGSHVIAYRVVETAADLPTNYFYADLEMLSEASNTDINGGMIEVRINGVTIISESNVLTTSSQDKFYNNVRLLCGSSNAHGVTADIDDYYIWNDQGSWNNSFLGDRRCFLIKPNQDTNVSDFDPSSGSFGYKMIDDESPDDDSTYIIAESYLQTGSPLSGTSEFEIENLPAGASLISAINVFVRSAKTDSTSAEIYTSVNSGSNSLSSDSHTLTTSYAYYNDIYEYDPSSIAGLTRDGFNSLSVSITADELDSEAAPVSPDVISPSEVVSPSDVVSPSEESDPFFGNVISLLHFDGTDASTTFTDEIGNTWTANGNAQIDTADSKFGGASGLFDGTGDYLRSTETTEFDIGTQDFTLEAWVKPVSASPSGFQFVFCRQKNGPNVLALQLRMTTSGKIEGVIRGAGSLTVYMATGTTTLSTSSFTHVALTRESGTLRIFTGGNFEDFAELANSNLSDTTQDALIGAFQEGTGTVASFWDGWIDDLRLTVGTARYTANFTPPSAPFPDF